MKKLFDEELVKKLLEIWNVVLSPPNDGTKYGNINMDARVKNEILGHCSVRKVVELENSGAIIYQNGMWKIKTTPIQITESNKHQFRDGRYIGEIINIPCRAWYDYMEKERIRSERERQIHSY